MVLLKSAYQKKQYILWTFQVYIKGKSAIAVARQFSGRQRNFNGEKLWARGYAVSTVGFEEAQIKAYIKQQEDLDKNQSNEEIGSF